LEDRWQQLRAYRKAKGLCFTCGEKWARDHQCKGSVQLHVVQEMLEFLQAEEQLYYECEEADGVAPHQVMCVSAAATGSEASEQTLQIVMEIQGHTLSVK
jgi:hypothetical protein